MGKKNMLTFMVCIFVCCITTFCHGAFSGTVKKVIDGDSIVIYAQKRKIEVRLYGIDCPEYNQPFSKKAKDYLTSKVYRKKVIVHPQYYDSYGRLVAIISYGTGILNEDIVGSGLAWVYPKYCKKRLCKSWKKLESIARRQGKGLWVGDKPVAPWRWRKKNN